MRTEYARQIRAGLSAGRLAWDLRPTELPVTGTQLYMYQLDVSQALQGLNALEGKAAWRMWKSLQRKEAHAYSTRP